MTVPGAVLLRNGTTSPPVVGLGTDDKLLYVRAGTTYYIGADGIEHEFIGATVAAFTAHTSATGIAVHGLGTAATQPTSAFDAAGAATAAVATHAGLADPHPVYLTAAEGNAAYDATGAASSAVAAHAAAGDPHPVYLTAAEGNAAYDGTGAATAAQAAAVQRGNHTGTQLAATISDFTEAAQDAAGLLLADSAELDVTYNDAGNVETIALFANGVARSKLAQAAGGVILGRAFGVAAGDLTDLTDDQVAQIVNNGVTARAMTTTPVLSAVVTEQVVQTFTLPAAVHSAGDTYLLNVFGLLVNAASINMATARVRVGAVGSVLTGAVVCVANKSTAAIARAAPGQSFMIQAVVTVKSLGAGGTIGGGVSIDGVVFDGGAFPAAPVAQISAPVAIDTTQARDIAVTFQQTVANAGTVLAATITKA